MQQLYIGIDVGSTTIKVVVLNKNLDIVYKHYGRHYSRVRESAKELLEGLSHLLSNSQIKLAVTGSAGYGMSRAAGLEFVQEVFATRIAIEHYYDDIDVVIELGGEDAKILFLTGGTEERMNGSCAGGTGAFIDQMAVLLGVSLEELDTLSSNHKKIYNIASRCGVFAKSDIQPLLNQGANKTDISASIYQAVVDQTIGGLAQGREIKGRVAFLGGPLTFQEGLRDRFKETLKLTHEEAILPENSEYFIALGAALYSRDMKTETYDEIIDRINKSAASRETDGSLPALFTSDKEYEDFTERHSKSKAKHIDINTYSGDAYLGIDAGSTTLKLVLITPEGEILYTYYKSNFGEPVPLVKEQLSKIYDLCGNRINIKASASTGYGEELIKRAFHLDGNLVETVAHYYAARFFNPKVDFILDIGGQDIKCFKIKNKSIDSIMLNEACSSGCGSFIDTCAQSLGFDISKFADLALLAKHPVDLGSRCTVFMNSSIKQAQKDGASIGDIAAGLAVSVIKNALYKVIRINDPSKLGDNIVVQGGTLLNDAILRSFEVEIKKNVTRPSISELMGAFGAALYAMSLDKAKSTLLSESAVKNFTHTSRGVICRGCTNNCSLTVNKFNNSDRYISGNRCETPLGNKGGNSLPNIYSHKLGLLERLESKPGPLGKIGIPLGLNMYENLPFWHRLLTHMGFEVVISGISKRETYFKGQHTIPSDTICYPAKLMHGHIKQLLEMGIRRIFYPCMPYNFDENLGDNNYNCPIVAYYPELLDANISKLRDVKFSKPYFNPENPRNFIKDISNFFYNEFGVPRKVTRQGIKLAFRAQNKHMEDIREYGRRAIEMANEQGHQVIILAGRPYHIDPAINHGMDQLVNSLGLVVISEDCVSHKVDKFNLKVLNQWTYHSRLYAAAKYACKHDNIQLVQLVSFGCGLDAITTDEIRDILENNSKFYTQIKIDEISNLGAARIRLRSLVAATQLQGRS
ncbi:MAG TPA: acyl-CoA dehydratase activase [Bacillota bacterium]|nr:acyl-CoA dehydratase activase [Bacillota bacterium]